MKFVLTGRKLGRVVLVSSFGTQSSVLLHMVADIDPQTQVLFIDTGKLFPQTLHFQKELSTVLNLASTKLVKQDSTKLTARDRDGSLWNTDNNACCDLRKVEPLKNELDHFDSWISGRKIFQGGKRSSLKLFEKSGKHIKINPLANWSQDQIETYIDRFSLPAHPLVNEGYSSVGCMPCTSPAAELQSSREGRWSGMEKTECGIHLPNDIFAKKSDETRQQIG